MHLRLERYASPVAELWVLTDEAGLLRVLEFGDKEERVHRHIRSMYGECEIKSGAAPDSIRSALDAYFAGDLTAVDEIPMTTGGTEFQRRVWQELRKIPAGTTKSYGQLAANVGCPAASRAVGAANGSNPIAIVVPCHRVIGANGKLTGYGGGLPKKQWLLEHERKHSTADGSNSKIQLHLVEWVSSR